MLRYAICALVAPAVAWAAAFPWMSAEPTFVIPEPDRWSPAPTEAPRVGSMDLFKRGSEADGTCGYLSGLESSSITCFNSGYVCATNTFYGVHGCCDPNDIFACSIPTTCIPSSLMSASCTDSVCSSNSYIAKCTGSEAPNCYEWHFVYSRTVMTEHGCDASGFTMTVELSIRGASTSLPPEMPVTITVKETVTPSDTTSPAAAPSQDTQSKKTPIAAVVGGTVGGCTVISVIAFAVFYIRHKRKKKTIPQSHTHRPEPQAPGVAEYYPQGYPPAAFTGQDHREDHKAWRQQQCTTDQLYGASSNPALQYPGAVHYGAEIDGRAMYEAPT